jgi:hypothetical protein
MSDKKPRIIHGRMMQQTSGKSGWDNFDPRRRRREETLKERESEVSMKLLSSWEWVPCTCQLVQSNDPDCFTRTHIGGKDGLLSKKITVYNE